MSATVKARVPAGTAPADERRARDRLRVLIPGTVVCEDGARFHCVVRDMSSTGAKLGLAREHRLPERFRLVVAGYPLGYPMRRAWQRGDFAGVMLALKTAVPLRATEAS